MMFLGRYPAFWIGLVGSILLAIAQGLTSNLSPDAFIPLIAGAVTHCFVTPVAPAERGL